MCANQVNRARRRVLYDAVMAEGLEGRPLVGYEIGETIDQFLQYIPNTGRFLEIGSYDGATIGWLARQRPGVQFVSVDPYLDITCDPSLAAGDSAGWENLQRWYKNRAKNQLLFLGKSAEFFNLMAGSCAMFDAVYIDGDHSEEGCSLDLAGSVLLIKGMGTIMLHDYREKFQGVCKAVDAFILRHGWEIVERKGSFVALKRKLG